MAKNGGKCLQWFRQIWLDEGCDTCSEAALLASAAAALGLALWSGFGGSWSQLAKLAGGLLARLPF